MIALGDAIAGFGALAAGERLADFLQQRVVRAADDLGPGDGSRRI
jgi:hypothetical protein